MAYLAIRTNDPFRSTTLVIKHHRLELMSLCDGVISSNSVCSIGKYAF